MNFKSPRYQGILLALAVKLEIALVRLQDQGLHGSLMTDSWSSLRPLLCGRCAVLSFLLSCDNHCRELDVFVFLSISGLHSQVSPLSLFSLSTQHRSWHGAQHGCWVHLRQGRRGRAFRDIQSNPTCHYISSVTSFVK
jgi:hypothetical protein